MSDEYQLRKDIDKVLDLASDLQDISDRNNVSSLNELLELYPDVSQLESLSANLTSLKDSLIDFNEALIDFDDDNTNLAENLKKLKENLQFVLTDVDNLKEGSAEFNDALDEFGVDIDEFVETLMGLNDDLNVLSDYILTFEGDLEDFQEELIAHGIDTSVLGTDMGKLVQAMAKVRSRTTDAEDNIDELKDDIGTDEGFDPSTDHPSNIKQWLAWLHYTIGDDTQGHETGLIKDIVDLIAFIGDEDDDPATSNTVYASINAVMDDIDGITAMIGSASDSNTILGKIASINTTIGDNNSGLVKQLNDASATITALSTTVGDANSGLVKKANDLDTAIGSNTSGSESGLYLLIKNATDSITNITTNIIGSNTQGHESGIYLLIRNATDSIATINTKIGSDTSGSESGLYLALKNATDSISSINTKIGSNTSGSETGIYALIKGAIDSITDINTKIGDNTSGSESGIYLSLKNLSDSISNAESIMGTDTPSTGSDTIWGRIHAYLTRLDNISNTSGTGALDTLEDAVGTVDVATDGDLQTQVTNLISNIDYIMILPTSLDVGDTATLSVSLTQKGEDYLLDGNTISVLHITPDPHNYEDIYLTSSDIVGQFAEKTITFTEVGTHLFMGDTSIWSIQVGKTEHWIEYDLNSTVFSLYYNPALRLCELRMVYQISGSASGTGEHNVTTSTIPSAYRPSSNVIGTLNRGGGSIRVDSSGNIYWITAVTQSVGTYLYGSVMWHY